MGKIKKLEKELAKLQEDNENLKEALKRCKECEELIKQKDLAEKTAQ